MTSAHTLWALAQALLIGINYTGQKGQLRGCANDVKQIAAFLKGRGFDSIQMLVDDGSGQGIPPTKTNILAGFRWLLNGARGGDSLFWHYSGHGMVVHGWLQRSVIRDAADFFSRWTPPPHPTNLYPPPPSKATVSVPNPISGYP